MQPKHRRMMYVRRCVQKDCDYKKFPAQLNTKQRIDDFISEMRTQSVAVACSDVRINDRPEGKQVHLSVYMYIYIYIYGYTKFGTYCAKRFVDHLLTNNCRCPNVRITNVLHVVGISRNLRKRTGHSRMQRESAATSDTILEVDDTCSQLFYRSPVQVWATRITPRRAGVATCAKCVRAMPFHHIVNQPLLTD